eukprot:10751632-Ditylum_brightwellii.AAC.2
MCIRDSLYPARHILLGECLQPVCFPIVASESASSKFDDTLDASGGCQSIQWLIIVVLVALYMMPLPYQWAIPQQSVDYLHEMAFVVATIE